MVKVIALACGELFLISPSILNRMNILIIVYTPLYHNDYQKGAPEASRKTIS